LEIGKLHNFSKVVFTPIIYKSYTGKYDLTTAPKLDSNIASSEEQIVFILKLDSIDNYC